MGIDVSKIKNPHLRKRLEELHGVRTLVLSQPAPAVELPPTPVRTAKSKRAVKPAPKVLANVPLSTFTTSEGEKSTELFLSVYGAPISKPRMTHSDSWRNRPCVLRYREYCDRLREVAKGHLPPGPDKIHVIAYLPVSESWSKKKKEASLGKPHRLKPDGDNMLKAVCDGLLKEDSCLWWKLVEKYWCEPHLTRVEIRVIYLR